MTSKLTYPFLLIFSWGSEDIFEREEVEGSSHLNHSIIESQTSRRCFLQDLLLQRIVLGKCIYCKRFWPRVYELNAFFNIIQLLKEPLSCQTFSWGDFLIKWIQSQVLLLQLKAKITFCKRKTTMILFENQFGLTVMIGSNGPNISSIMISASRGGFNKIVGSITLKNSSNRMRNAVCKQ